MANIYLKTSPLEFEDIRSAIHCYKLIFQIPSLKMGYRSFLKNLGELPHGAYRNRGNFRRYVSKLPSNIKK